MNDSVKKAIVDTLGQDNEDDRYYVYALCEETDDGYKPFYIGKGQTDRVWQHEEDAKKLLETLENEAKKQKMEADEKKKSAFTEKHKQIKKLIDEKRYVRKIIKWGLNSQEAFMVESALINYIGFENLTNIVNGHCSLKEKNSKIGTTQVMSTDEFYEKCCKSNICFENIKEKWLFININKFYSKIDYNDPEQVGDAACGYWIISKELNIEQFSKANEPVYMFVVYRSRIVNIYQLEKRIIVRDLKDLSEEEREKICPKYPKDSREQDNKAIAEGNSIMNKSLFVYNQLSGDHKLFEGLTVGDMLNRLVLTENEESIFSRQVSVRYPAVKIDNKANVKGLRKQLANYFLKVDLYNSDKGKDNGKADYTITSNDKNSVELAKDIYDSVIKKNRAELLKSIK